jgi:hypothetical protein
MCGKLKCCLKYEDNDYKQMTEGLPKMGSQVEYEGEIYRITNMNVMSEEAKLENHQTAIFITLDDLRNKAIPRKGAVMKKRDPATDKPGHKTIIHTNKPAEEPKKEDRVLAAPTASESRSFGHGNNRNNNNNNNNNQRHSDNNRNNNNNRNRNNNNRNNEAKKPVQESKNVTVRTFGHKKSSGETK